MELQQLRCFAAVAEHLHFTRAAESVKLAQPHVSREIGRLERELGVKLFVRSTRQVQITQAGQEFLASVTSIFDELEQGAAKARSVHNGKRGTLVAAFAGSTTYSWLPFMTNAYRRRYPQVDMEIRSEMLTGSQVDALINGRIDIGLLRPPVNNDKVATLMLDNEPLVVAVPRDHRLSTVGGAITVAELEPERFIGYRGLASNTHKAVVKACLNAGFVPNVVQTVADTHSLVSLVAAGMGIAVVPRSTQHFAVPGVKYLTLARDSVRLPLLMGWRASPERPIVRNFVELVKDLADADDWPGREQFQDHADAPAP